MIKIVFLDIDGTLVSFKTHRVPQSALDAIHSVREKGVKIWIATGRPIPFIYNLDGLEYDGIISVNGAHCQTKDGEVIYTNPVCREDVERLLQRQQKTGMVVVYAGTERAIMVAPKGVPEEVVDVFALLDIKMPKVYAPEEALKQPVHELVSFFREPETEDIMANVLTHCNQMRWHETFADCVALGTDKASGIDAVLAHYGFDISNTMAFGDGGNDIGMLHHVAVGVAMGNASDEVKQAADIITTSVDEDGIANVLRQMF